MPAIGLVDIDPGPPSAGKSPRLFFLAGGVVTELSIFIDESGDFGSNSDYYLLTLVFHDQGHDISSQLERLALSLRDAGLSVGRAIHTGPLVRREEEYSNMRLNERRRIFDKLLTFARTCGISYKTFALRKSEYPDRMRLKARLSREVSLFIRDNLEYFLGFDHVIAYYDNGQSEITDLVNSVFGAVFFDVEFRRVVPSDYRLFQCADLFCTLELIALKDEWHEPLSHSEELFFESRRRFRKDYLKTARRLRFECAR